MVSPASSPLRMFFHYLRRTTGSALLFAVCAIISVLVAACSDSSDRVPARAWSNTDILAISPEQTRWATAIDLQAPDAEGLAGELDSVLMSQSTHEPVFHAFASLLDSATAGLNPTADFSNFTLHYLLSPEPSLLLLADSYNNNLKTLFGTGSLVHMLEYRRVSLYRHDDSGSVVAMLPGALLSIGSTATIMRAIDRYYDGDGPPDTILANALAAEIDQGPIAFAMTLAEAQASGSRPGDVPTLEAAELLSGALNVSAGKLVGSARFKMRDAEIFFDRFATLTGDVYQGRVSAPTPRLLEIDVSMNVNDLFNRFLLKQLSFGMDGIAYAENTGVGANLPWLTFNVRSEPSSIFINFTFASEAKRRDFERKHLPQNFKLAPLRILAGEKPQYYLVLNIYGSSGGLVEGARAEWSVFVKDPEFGVPRFLVVEAVAASLAADPVNLLTFPEPVEHTLGGGKVKSYVGRNDKDGIEATYFKSSFAWPQQGGSAQRLDPVFAVANDYIFWGNAVADQGLYNGSVHARDVALIDPDTFQFEDNSSWSKYLNPTPQHVLSYQNALELVISPWANLEANYLDVTESHLQNLINFSNDFYPMTAMAQALAAFNGAGDVTRPRNEGTVTPSMYFHFPIIDTQGMTAVLADRGAHPLAAVTLAEGQPASPYLTLHIYAYEQDACGTRADWLTYTTNPDTNRVETLHLDRASSEACIDAETLFRPAARVQHKLRSGRSYVTANSLNTRFSASADPALGTARPADASLVAASDEQCRLAGFCDRYFYNGDTLTAPLIDVDPSAVDITHMATPWDSFIDSQPTTVTFRDKPRLLLTLPWTNIKPDTEIADPGNRSNKQ